MPVSQSPPFPYGFGDFGDEPLPAESRRLTPSIGLAHDSDQPAANEDFLFHLYRGSELLQDNRVHEAKEELERALHLQPRDSKGQDLIAVVYFRLGHYPRAIQIYESLRRRNANDTSLLLNLALCYLKTGQTALARRDLEQLVGLNPGHTRAWGYLGVACERLGDFAAAERAFEQGGHTQMAKRLAAKRAGAIPAPAATPARAYEPPSSPRQEVRDVAGTAYQELDAGELSFAIAEPTSDRDVHEEAAASWRPHELGALKASGHPETQKPDTKDGPPAVAPGPSIAAQYNRHAPPVNRRPTLIAPVGAPPAHGFLANELAALERIPSQKPPSFALDDAGAPPIPSLRRPVVAVPSPFGPARTHDAIEEARTRTLAPPLGGSAPPQGPGSSPPEEGPPPSNPPASVVDYGRDSAWSPPSIALELPKLDTYATPPNEPDPPTRAAFSERKPSEPPKPTFVDAPIVQPSKTPSLKPETARSSSYFPPVSVASMPRPAPAVEFPKESGVVLHASGLALARTTNEVGFVARLEALRAQQNGLKLALLERHVKGKPNGESFGGVASPMVNVTGDGELVLGARPGRKLHAFPIDEMCFAREDVLLGFGGGSGVAFENGRLATGEGEHLPVVQLRGNGAVILEAIGEIVALSVRSDRSLSVRRESILGWFGRLVPRAIAPSDAPAGQRGLVSFAGEGRVLLTGA